MTYDKKLFFFYAHALFISFRRIFFIFGKKIANLAVHGMHEEMCICGNSSENQNSKEEEKRR